MTIHAVEGTLTVPETPAKALRGVPEGPHVLSEPFRPNPDDDPNSSALFNVFIESHDFAGDVHLLKAAPSDTKEFEGCYFRVQRQGADLAWTMAPDDHVCDTVQEPENGVAYYLAIFGGTAGQEVYYRMSL